MLLTIDTNYNISLARGYAVNIPVSIQRANGSNYEMLPGDTLSFVVKKGTNAQTALINITSNEPLISLASTDTVGMPYGAYVYDLVLTDADGWTETILGPADFFISGDDDEAMTEYRRLLTSEYRTRPKLQAWLLWLISSGLSHKTVLSEIVNAFDLDTAVGSQLDVLGQITGVQRKLSFYPSDGSGPIASDDIYRFMIKAKIIQNMWQGTLPELYEMWAALFPDIKYFQIQDLQDMSFNVVIMGDLPLIKRDLISKGYIIPKPEGVRINLMTITDTSGLPVFAYDVNTHMLSGYTSHWSEPEP